MILRQLTNEGALNPSIVSSTHLSHALFRWTALWNELLY